MGDCRDERYGVGIRRDATRTIEAVKGGDRILNPGAAFSILRLYA